MWPESYIGHMHPTPLLTTRQAAEKLSISVRTVHRWINDGKLAAQKVPGYKGAYLIAPASVEQLAEKQDAA